MKNILESYITVDKISDTRAVAKVVNLCNMKLTSECYLFDCTSTLDRQVKPIEYLLQSIYQNKEVYDEILIRINRKSVIKYIYNKNGKSDLHKLIRMLNVKVNTIPKYLYPDRVKRVLYSIKPKERKTVKYDFYYYVHETSDEMYVYRYFCKNGEMLADKVIKVNTKKQKFNNLKNAIRDDITQFVMYAKNKNIAFKISINNQRIVEWINGDTIGVKRLFNGVLAVGNYYETEDDLTNNSVKAGIKKNKQKYTIVLLDNNDDDDDNDGENITDITKKVVLIPTITKSTSNANGVSISKVVSDNSIQIIRNKFKKMRKTDMIKQTFLNVMSVLWRKRDKNTRYIFQSDNKEFVRQMRNAKNRKKKQGLWGKICEIYNQLKISVVYAVKNGQRMYDNCIFDTLELAK